MTAQISSYRVTTQAPSCSLKNTGLCSRNVAITGYGSSSCGETNGLNGTAGGTIGVFMRGPFRRKSGMFEGTGQLERRIIAKYLTGLNPT
jgi:hypothetical protein